MIDETDDSIEAFIAKTELFEKETHIWPPGRDMAPEMAMGEKVEDMRMKAWGYWCKAKAELAGLKAIVGALRDDALANAVVDDCKDPNHDLRWCQTCSISFDAIDAYREAVKAAAEKPMSPA